MIPVLFSPEMFDRSRDLTAYHDYYAYTCQNNEDPGDRFHCAWGRDFCVSYQDDRKVYEKHRSVLPVYTDPGIAEADTVAAVKHQEEQRKQYSAQSENQWDEFSFFAYDTDDVDNDRW